MTREEIIDFCEMKAELEPENEAVFNYMAKALAQETTSRESYEHEYFLRKELDFKVARLEKQIAEQEHGEDGMEKHTDRQIYDGCIHLMQKMVDYFQEYLEYIGYDLDKLDEDDRFAVGISNMEIVRWLFLFHTRNSGGCSTIDFCEKIGIDDSEIKFEFERDEE